MLRHFAAFKFRREYIFYRFHDLCGVVVILSKNQRLGHVFPFLFPVGVQLVIDGFFVGCQHLADLILVHHGAIQGGRIVVHPLVGCINRFPACPAGCFHELRSRTYCSAVLGDLGLDAIDAGRHIDTIHHGIIVGIILNDVIIEERIGFRRGCGGKAQDMRAREIIQHCPPLAVNGAVAFIHDDQLEVIRRNPQITIQADDIFALFFFLLRCPLVFGVLAVLRKLLPGQYGKQLLNGGNYNVGFYVVIVFQPLDLIEGAHFRLTFCAVKLAEFAFRLTGQVVPVHQKQDAAHRGIIQQAVAGQAGQIGFAAAGGKHGQAFLFSVLDGVFKLHLGAILAIAQATLVQSRQSAIGRNLMDQLEHFLGRMHFSQFHIIRIRRKQIPEINLAAICQINQRDQSIIPETIPVLRMGGIALGLGLHVFCQWVFLPFGLHHSDGFVVHKKQIIAFSVTLHQCFFHSGSTVWNILFTGYNLPTGFFQLPVNLLTCSFFRKHGDPPLT